LPTDLASGWEAIVRNFRDVAVGIRVAGPYPAIRNIRAMPPHIVVVVALDGVLPIDLAVPAQVFGPGLGMPYELKVCGVRRKVRTSFGFSVEAEHLLDAVGPAGTVIIPGYEDITVDPPRRVLNYLKGVHRQGGRVASICTGAFALGAAGVAMQSGLGSATNFRARFRSAVGTTPTAYRSAFSSATTSR
jgi:transcriptional regulator GlxA family with amidase domain